MGQGQLLLLLVLGHPHGSRLLLLVHIGVHLVAMSSVGLRVRVHSTPQGEGSRASSPGSSARELSAGREREWSPSQPSAGHPPEKAAGGPPEGVWLWSYRPSAGPLPVAAPS